MSFTPALSPFASPVVSPAAQAGTRDAYGQRANSGGAMPFKSPEGDADQYDQVSLSVRAMAARSAGQAVAPLQGVARQFADSFGAALFSGPKPALDAGASARLVGSAPITTNDGQRFDLEIEVDYQSRALLAAPDTATLTGQALPAIKFPGSLNDLFKLLGRQLASDRGTEGDLTLRLTRLVDRAALLAPRQQDDTVTLGRSRQAASAYASAPRLSDLSDD